MKQHGSILSHYFHKIVRLVFLLLTLVVPMLLTSCGDPIGAKDAAKIMADTIQKTLPIIQSESGAWREQLSVLYTNINGLEDKIATDAKAIVGDTLREIERLRDDTLALTDQMVLNWKSEMGVEFRCNVDFVKEATIKQLEFMVQDLKFWQDHDQVHLAKPAHGLCGINPDHLRLYPIGNGMWSIHNLNQETRNTVVLYGYNFRTDALPDMEFRDGSGRSLGPVTGEVQFQTRYEIHLDLGRERFEGLEPDWTIILTWKDAEVGNEYTVIDLDPATPANLDLGNVRLTPTSSPIVNEDMVTLRVTITNTGELSSNSFTVVWRPDPMFPNAIESSPPHIPLEANETAYDVYVGSYRYERVGTIISTITIESNTGGDVLHVPVVVQSPPIYFKLDPNTTHDISNSEGIMGGGCSPFRHSYTNNMVITRLTGRFGNVIYRIGLWCSPLNLDGTLGEAVQTTSSGVALSSGGTGGSPFDSNCPQGQALKVLDGNVDDYEDDKGDRRVVSQISGICVEIIVGQASYQLPTYGRRSGVGSFRLDCPANQFMTGILGRSGRLLDNISITCTGLAALP